MSTDPLLVGLPTHDGRAIVTSITALSRVGNVLRRPVVFLIGEASNIPRSRNLVLHEARIRPDVRGDAWILWMDSDIVIPAGSVEAIAEAILWAEAGGNSWVAHYRMASGESVLMPERSTTSTQHYGLDELEYLEDFAEIGMSGLGLAYIKTDIQYVFHADILGEDVHFFMDQPQLTIHYAKQVRVLHRKTVLI